MAAYPASPAPSFPLNITRKYNTLISDFDSGAEQRRRLWRFPKRSVTLDYRNISLTDRNTLAAWFNSYYGSYSEFYFFDPLLRNWTDEYVGRGTGAVQTFDLHSKTTTEGATLNVYVDGVEATLTDEYVFVSAGGTEGADRITFDGGHIPAAGTLITADFNGYLRLKVRFAEDGFSEDQPSLSSLFNVRVSLTEIQW